MNKTQLVTARSAAIKNALILAGFALISTGLIAITHLITEDKISLEIEVALAKQLNKIIPADTYDNNPNQDCIRVTNEELLGTQKPIKIYRLRNNNSPYALFIASVAPDGYAGKIRLVVGVYQDGKLAGVRVTEHQETPGLGDKIELEKSPWIKQFDGKSLTNLSAEEWQVKKDGGTFDAMTGATITPRAIVKAVYNSLLYFQQNEQALFAQAKSCGADQ